MQVSWEYVACHFAQHYVYSVVKWFNHVQVQRQQPVKNTQVL